MNDLIDVLQELGVEVTSWSDSRVFGLCPGHEEYTGRPDGKPSWSMDREMLVHHCWSCPYRGTLRQLITDLKGGVEAREWLSDYTRRRAVRRLRKTGRVQPASSKPPVPQTALQRRLERFSDPPDEALEARGLERFAVVHYGVRWDEALGHWIIPIHDAKGRLAGYQRKGDGFFKNVPEGMRKKFMLFGLSQFAGGWAWLVESPLDVVRLYSEGLEGGVSSFGAYVSNAQLALLVDRAYDIVLALDNDEAGTTERDRIWWQWRHPHGIRVRALDYSGIAGKDVGDMTSAQIRQLAVHPRRWKPPRPDRVVPERDGRRRTPVSARGGAG